LSHRFYNGVWSFDCNTVPQSGRDLQLGCSGRRGEPVAFTSVSRSILTSAWPQLAGGVNLAAPTGSCSAWQRIKACDSLDGIAGRLPAKVSLSKGCQPWCADHASAHGSVQATASAVCTERSVPPQNSWHLRCTTVCAVSCDCQRYDVWSQHFWWQRPFVRRDCRMSLRMPRTGSRDAAERAAHINIQIDLDGCAIWRRQPEAVCLTWHI
jgi:hypothetical protein